MEKFSRRGEENEQQQVAAGAAIGLSLACATVQAEVKDPLPDSLSLGGVTCTPRSTSATPTRVMACRSAASISGGLEYQAFTTTRNFAGSQSRRSRRAGSSNPRSASGCREPIIGDLTLVGEDRDGIQSAVGPVDRCLRGASPRTAAEGRGTQTANADSSRCGQAVQQRGSTAACSNPALGTLTIGRHNSLQLDALAAVRPANTVLCLFVPGLFRLQRRRRQHRGARAGTTAVKYAFPNGPLHLAAMYSNGGQDTGILGKAYRRRYRGDDSTASRSMPSTRTRRAPST